MARKAETRTIGDVEYTVLQLPGENARKLLVRLTNLAGPALRAASGGKYLHAIGELLATLKDADLEYLIKEFKPLTTIKLKDGNEPSLVHVFDEIFGGDGLRDMFVWLAFCLELNYRSFFPDLAEIESALKGGSSPGEMAKVASPST